MPTQPPSITYVVSQYPAISHTFILGEVNGIKAKGIDVHVASINQPDRAFDQLTAIEQAACKESVFVKSAVLNPIGLLRYTFKTLLASPKGFFCSLGNTLRSALAYPRQLPQHIAYWLEAMVVADMAKKNGSQQLHAHFSTQGCTVAMLAAQIADIDFSFTVHGPDEFYNVDEQYLEKKFSAANFIVCISDFARSQVMKYTAFDDWDKLHINYLGVDSSLFHPSKKPEQPTCPTLLCVGRLCNAKGQGVLIQAAKILSERGVNYRVHFVGDGPDREKLEAFSLQHGLTEQLTFLGKINHDQVQVLQREADIFVLPSFAEGIPIVLMEAMASGTPCVTTHITGIPELFTHNDDGLLVRPGNATQLADALEALINDGELRARIANNALQTITRDWDLQNSNARLADIFQQQLQP